jgi:hypothetical protein
MGFHVGCGKKNNLRHNWLINNICVTFMKTIL